MKIRSTAPIVAGQLIIVLLLLAAVSPTQAKTSNAVNPGPAAPAAVGATWISISSPFTEDANKNSYTSYAYGTSSSGPWTPACGNGVPGETAWRFCVIGSLTPGTSYYVQVTFVDPDGVIGTNPQIVGPIVTNSVSNPAVTVGTASALAEDTDILVTVPISNDSDMNSSVSNVSIATSSSGPWTQKCYSGTFSPSLCSIHGLTKNTSYFIQVTVTDPDGVNGPNPQVIGPIHYKGLTDLALNKLIWADPGWGCCPNPSELVDGVIQYGDWTYGFAWTGGTGDWGGGTPGFKQATIDLGTTMSVNRMDWWAHDPLSVPTTWLVSVSTDNVNYSDVAGTVNGNCRAPALELDTAWNFPSCGQSATFTPVSARYVRFWTNDYTLFGGLHEWAVEIEVFGPGQ